MHALSTVDWYEVSANDRIIVELKHEDQAERMVFLVPESGLPNPPVSLDDLRAGRSLHEYLKTCCARVE